MTMECGTQIIQHVVSVVKRENIWYRFRIKRFISLTCSIGNVWKRFGSLCFRFGKSAICVVIQHLLQRVSSCSQFVTKGQMRMFASKRKMMVCSSKMFQRHVGHVRWEIATLRANDSAMHFPRKCKVVCEQKRNIGKKQTTSEREKCKRARLEPRMIHNPSFQCCCC